MYLFSINFINTNRKKSFSRVFIGSILLSISASSYANAILPITNMWQGPSKIFFLAYFVIVIVEAFILWKKAKSDTFKKSFGKSLLINLGSSVIGALVIYLFFNISSKSLWINYEKFYGKFIIFFILTLISEAYLLLKIDKSLNLKSSIKISLLINCISYFILLLFQVALLTGSLAFSDHKHDSYVKKWGKDKKNIDLSKTNYVYAIFDGGNSTRTYVKMISGTEKRSKLEVVDISYPFLLIKPKTKDYSSKGYIFNDVRELKVLDVDNANVTRIFNTSGNNLNVLIYAADLEGVVEGNGERRVYGNSYSVNRLQKNRLLDLGLNDVINEKLYKYHDELFFIKHSKCKFDSKESTTTRKINRCENFKRLLVAKKENKTRVVVDDVWGFQIVNDSLYYVKNKRLYKRNLLNKRDDIVIDDNIDSFVVDKNQKYLLIKHWAFQPFHHTCFLILINLHSKKRTILEEGQIVSFDFIN
ncbi:DUF4199 domain-containing protein [bacterium]|nr:DUF4199 domain-containing protein [bacterium]